jgi:hypothetical protein
MAKHNYPKSRKIGRPIGSTVLRAREALQAHAAEAAGLVVEAARVSAKRGNYTAAAWVLEHTSAIVDGKEIRPIASGIDRQTVDTSNRALTVNVGWIGAPGGANSSTERIIDVAPIAPLALPEDSSE